MKSKLYLFVGVLLLVCSMGCVRDNAINDMLFSPSDADAANAPTAKVSDFVTAYRENSAKADKDYYGKWVKVQGRIDAIERLKWTDGRTYYFVKLRDDSGKSPKGLNCRFNFNRESEILNLKTNQVVKIFGHIDRVIEFGEMPTISDSRVVN